MAGFMDFFDTDQARLGMGLLAAAGPRADGAGFGQRLMEGVGSLDQWKQQGEQKKLRDMQLQQAQMQMDDAKRKQQQEQAQRDWRTGLPAVLDQKVYGASDVGPTMAPDAAGLNKYLLSPDSPFADKLLERKLFPKEGEGFTLGDGQVRYDSTGQVVAQGPAKAPSMPSGVQEYQFAKEQGYPGTFEQWTIAGKKAGATNVSTRIDNKMGDSLASQVGPMVKDTYTAAQGAVQQIDAAKRIISAVDSGRIIAGPLANGRLTVAQIGQMVGVTGKDDADTIARSRDVIRGLAEMTLQGRKQMSGQGAITESEGKLAEKANSGDINDLTPAEIKQLARASARAAQFVYGQHSDNLTNLQSDPNTAKLAGFYKVRPLPQIDLGTQTNTDDLVSKYRSK